MKQELNSPRPLPSTYVTSEQSGNREKYFNDLKYPILNALTLLQERTLENRKLDFKSIEIAITFFKQIIKNRMEKSGVRVYFASPSGDGSVGESKCGKLTLIFVATKGIEKTDEMPYYAFDNGTFVPHPLDFAKNAVHNYQRIKRNELFKTLSDQDIIDNCKETKHIWFSSEQIQDIIDEIEYQSQKHSDIVKGFGIRFTSYTCQDYQFGTSLPVKHKRRLSIGFTFVNSANQDIGIEDIDVSEFEERSRLGFRGDTMDTGVPAPPPPTNDNMAALDYEI
jgi:hypothetical protein